MDYCDLCFDRPEPIELRLLIHFVEVEARQKTWFSGERALYTVTVYNRSSLPLDRVVLTGGSAAFLDGSVRVNGLPEGGASPRTGILIPGLDAGGQVLVSWEEALSPGEALEEHPTAVRYRFRFDGEEQAGETQAE